MKHWVNTLENLHNRVAALEMQNKTKMQTKSYNRLQLGASVTNSNRFRGYRSQKNKTELSELERRAQNIDDDLVPGLDGDDHSPLENLRIDIKKLYFQLYMLENWHKIDSGEFLWDLQYHFESKNEDGSNIMEIIAQTYEAVQRNWLGNANAIDEIQQQIEHKKALLLQINQPRFRGYRSQKNEAELPELERQAQSIEDDLVLGLGGDDHTPHQDLSIEIKKLYYQLHMLKNWHKIEPDVFLWDLYYYFESRDEFGLSSYHSNIMRIIEQTFEAVQRNWLGNANAINEIQQQIEEKKALLLLRNRNQRH